MYRCNFCQRDFLSRQSFNAHCRGCDAYKQHKNNRSSASGKSLRQPVPKARPTQGTSPPILSSTSSNINDPLAPNRDFSQGLGVKPANGCDPKESPLQRRRKLLQTAKSKVVDYYCWVMGTVTTEMRAAAKLAIDRELRHEPLEELTPQEVDQLAEGVRDRVYNSFLRRQEKEAQRIQDEADRKRENQRDDDRKHTARAKRKAAYLDEARRRAVNFLKTCSLSPLKRLEALGEIHLLLNEVLTGDEPLAEAFETLDAILGARVTEMNAQEAAMQAKQQKEWQELATVVVAVLALWFTYAKGDEILHWLIKILSSMPAEGPGSPQNSTTQAAQQASDEHTPRRPIRRVRRPSQSSPPAPPSTSSEQESEYPPL